MILSRNKRILRGQIVPGEVIQVSSDLVADVLTTDGIVYSTDVLERAVKEFNKGLADCGNSMSNLGRLMFEDKKIAPADSTEVWHISHITEKVELLKGRVVANIVILSYSTPFYKKGLFNDKGSVTIELGEFLKEMFDMISEELVIAVIVGHGTVKEDGGANDDFRIERVDLNVMGRIAFPEQLQEVPH